MSDAIFEQTKVETEPKPGFLFNATGLVQVFNGYLAVYEEGRDEGDAGSTKAATLPALKVGEQLSVLDVRGSQHFTQPPPRFSEASLVKELEKRGIGRPSTYASIVTVIQDKEYVKKDDNKKFRPSELGCIVNDLLVENFPEVLDAEFTARMELKLDEVEEGTQDWRTLLGEFYGEFKQRLETAETSMKRVKREEIPTDILCDKCGEANMVVKWGRNGQFLACPRYPECKNAKPYVMDGNGAATQPPEPELTDEICDKCGKPMVIKNGRSGRFLACTGYPECRGTKPFKVGVKCPLCGTGDFVERVSKRGKAFYACSNYPDCKNSLWQKPQPTPCPKCGNPFMLLRETPKQRSLTCPNDQCKHVVVLSMDEGAADAGE